MSLDHLDDPNPPDFDAARWQRITRRSRALVRRRRYQRAAASFVVVAVIGLAAGVSVLDSSGSGVVHVSTPAPPSTSAPTPTTGLRPSDWVTVRLEVKERVVAIGHDVTGTMVFDNHRSTPVRLSVGGCAASWTVAVGSGRTNPGAAFAASCESPQAARAFAPGVSRLPFSAPTTYQGCGGTGNAEPSRPKCLPGNRMPLLPDGEASVWFETDGRIPHLVVPSGPITIRIVAPKSAR